MLKKILALVTLLYAALSFAAVDVNKGTAADLDGIKGIGPGISGKIVDERKKGNFKDWNDFIERVKGVGEGNAAKFSAEGLTVNGAGFKGAAAAPTTKADTKADAKAAAKPAATAAAAPAAAPTAAPTAKEEKKDPKAEAKAQKEADKKAKAEEKQKKAKKAKADAKAAKDAKPAAPAEAPKK
jgi:competence protein ComEA